MRKAGRTLFRFFASLRLAVILLVVLIVATAAGTIYESRFDARVARAYVYAAPWFNAWMILLAVNLAAAAFSRYPWKRHHTGFVVTHAGIITLLTGAVIGRIWGVEGTMTLFTGHEPSNRLVTDKQEVRITEKGVTTAFPLELKHRHSHPAQAVPLGVTPEGWTLAVTDFAEMLLPVTAPQPVTTGGTPALQVKLWNGRMTQQIEQWLWPADPDNRQIDVGLLAVECRSGTAPPAETKRAADAGAPAYLKKVSMASEAPTLPPGDRAIIYLADDGKLTYFVQNKLGETHQGVLETGKPMATSWGDWELMVAQVMPQAVSSTTFEPVDKATKLAPRDRANLTDGVKVRFSKGDDHDEEWLASGWDVELPSEHEPLQAAFGAKIVPLPVSLALTAFAVERNEGLDTAAGFKSTIMVRDGAGNAATGSCTMNEPMNFPDTFWRRWTGLTYKISQASWNPENLQQSSVQILLDPGWLFKWTGSLMVCIGIFTMFYLRPPRDIAHP